MSDNDAALVTELINGLVAVLVPAISDCSPSDAALLDSFLITNAAVTHTIFPSYVLSLTFL